MAQSELGIDVKTGVVQKRERPERVVRLPAKMKDYVVDAKGRFK